MTGNTDDADEPAAVGTLLHLLTRNSHRAPCVHPISFAEPDPENDPDFWQQPPSFMIVEYPSQFTPPSGSPLVGKAR